MRDPIVLFLLEQIAFDGNYQCIKALNEKDGVLHFGEVGDVVFKFFRVVDVYLGCPDIETKQKLQKLAYQVLAYIKK